MLILTRRVGERVVIGPDIAVEVIDVKGTQVRLEIDAHAEIEVHREEIAVGIASERGTARAEAKARRRAWPMPKGRADGDRTSTTIRPS